MPRPVQAPDGARQRLAATVAALRQPTAYPNEVHDVETIETHMAWVFLTEEHAYKLKKPIQSRLIDYTTIEARRAACEIELEVNRRLAAPVYLAVVPVTRSSEGMSIDADGVPVDWLVKMKRLPRRWMLDARIDDGTIRREHIDRLADKLSTFYRTARPVGWSGGGYRERIESNIEAKCTSLEHRRYGLSRGIIRSVLEKQKRWLAQHRDLLAGRAHRVVDAHGDLRPEHVCLEGEPMIIDSLEFSRKLRLLDPVSELSFLGLECRRLGAEWIGEQLLGLYEKRAQDEVSAPLIPFYESYHAIIRAAIAVWHLDDPVNARPDFWRSQAESYLEQARAVL